MIGKAIFSKLTGTEAIASIIGTRVTPNYFDTVDANGVPILPAICYEFSSPIKYKDFTGNSGITSITVAITSAAETYSAAQDLANKVLTALDMQTGTWGTTKVVGCFFQNEIEEDTENLTEAGKVVSLVTLPFVIWYT